MKHTKDEALKLAKSWFESNTYGDEAVEVYEAIEQALAAPVQEATAAINTLKFLGYTYHGGEQWKPPLGECPAWLNEPAPVQEPVAALIDENQRLRAELKFNTLPAAQPAVQEPVGYITQARCFVHLHECTEAEAKLYGWKTIYTTPPAQPAVPDALNPKNENPAYAAGWNDCRAEMLKGMKS